MEPRHEALAAYAFDVLDEQERADFEEHLAGCALCRRNLVLIGRETLALALDVAAVEPPAALRERILAAARLEPQERGTGRRAGFRLPSVRRWLLALVGLAVVLAVSCVLCQVATAAV